MQSSKTPQNHLKERSRSQGRVVPLADLRRPSTKVNFASKSASGLYDESQSYSYDARKSNVPRVTKTKTGQNYRYALSQSQTRGNSYKTNPNFLSVQNVGYFGRGVSESNLDTTGARSKHSSASYFPRREIKNAFSSTYHCGISSKKMGVSDMKRELPGKKETKLKQGRTVHNEHSKTKATKNVPSELNTFAVDSCINLTWNRRLCNGAALVTFESQNDFINARALLMKSVRLMKNELSIQISKNSKYQLFVTNIPLEAKVEDLEKALQHVAPAIKPENIEFKFEHSFETSEFELEQIQKQIEKKCNELNLKRYEVVLPMPKPTATIMKAYINITNGKNLDSVAEKLSKCSIYIPFFQRHAEITARPVYRSLIKWDLDVCKAIDPRLKAELAKLESEWQDRIAADDLFSVQIISTDATTAAIKVLTNNNGIMRELQKVINNLLEGDVLNESNFNYVDRFFSVYNDRVLKRLKEEENVLVLADSKAKIIRLYGSEENCFKAKKRFESLLCLK